MGNVEAWLDRDQQKKEAYRDILKQSPVSVNVYRIGGGADQTGFRSEATGYELAKTILARIDVARYGSKSASRLSVPEPTTDDAQFTALTDDNEVWLGDVWRVYDMAGQERFYKVVRVKANELGNSVWLDEMRKSRWPKLQD